MAYHVYPFADAEKTGTGFLVKLDGEKIDLHTALVSAYPFNRRWPGHQRDISQAEEISFAAFEMSGSVEVSIKPDFDFEEVVIRPLSKNIQYKNIDGEIVFNLPEPMYITVEFTGRNNALHIFADPEKKYEAFGDVIYYGTGIHDVGQIELKANQTLFIDEGAVVYACIKATDADNIRIIGRGILDNSRNKEKILFEANEENNDSAVNNVKRQHTVQIEYCNNVEIDGITIRDSLVYNIRPMACKNLNIRNVKIIGCWRYNSDGIDMHNCEDVHIDSCFIRTFDDSICVKGFDCYYAGTTEEIEKAVYEAMHKNGKNYENFKNVLVENCTIWNDWGKCLEIGAETRAEEICNITFKNCDIIHVHGAPLDCCNIDFADVHDVVYENINIEYDDVIPVGKIQRNDREEYVNDEPDYSPYLFDASVFYHFEYSAGGTRRGKNRNITVRNIHVNAGRHIPKIHLLGYDGEHKTENISISDIYVNKKRVENANELNVMIEENVSCVTFNVEKIYELKKYCKSR